MAGRMSVVAVRRTGNVLGAITAVAPGDAASVASMAGAAMPARVGTSSFDVPAAALAVADVEFDDRVFNDVSRAQLLLPGGSDQSASLAFVDSKKFATLGHVGPDTLTVDVTDQTGDDPVPFWVLFQGPPDEPALIVTGAIPVQSKGSGPVPHGLTKGVTYAALVLVTGLAPHEQGGITP